MPICLACGRWSGWSQLLTRWGYGAERHGHHGSTYISHLETCTITFLHTSTQAYLCVHQTCIQFFFTPASPAFFYTISKTSWAASHSSIIWITRTDSNRRDTAYGCLAACYIHHHGQRRFTLLPASRCFTMVTKMSVFELNTTLVSFQD